MQTWRRRPASRRLGPGWAGAGRAARAGRGLAVPPRRCPVPAPALGFALCAEGSGEGAPQASPGAASTRLRAAILCAQGRGRAVTAGTGGAHWLV